MNKLSNKQIERIQQTLFCSKVAMETAEKIRSRKMREEVEFNWKDKEAELQELIKNIVKEVNYFDKYYCKDCTAVLYWDGNDFVRYNCGALNDLECGPLRTIDFLHLSEERTKVIIRSTGEDITDKVEINPLYRDIFNDELLNLLNI